MHRQHENVTIKSAKVAHSGQNSLSDMEWPGLSRLHGPQPKSDCVCISKGIVQMQLPCTRFKLNSIRWVLMIIINHIQLSEVNGENVVAQSCTNSSVNTEQTDAQRCPMFRTHPMLSHLPIVLLASACTVHGACMDHTQWQHGPTG